MAERNERGFAAMDPEEQREIARRGGRAAHQSGNAHEFTSEEAAEAGRKGGEAVSRNREHMAEIGRKGGLAAHHRNAAYHHESAARHHRKAAHHHDNGEFEEGKRLSDQAHTQSETAHGHSRNSQRAPDRKEPKDQQKIDRKASTISDNKNVLNQTSEPPADLESKQDSRGQQGGHEVQEMLSRGGNDSKQPSNSEHSEEESGSQRSSFAPSQSKRGQADRQSDRQDLQI